VPVTYDALPIRVVFGQGALESLPEEVARLGLHRTLVVSTPRRGDAVERAAELLGDASVGVFDGARMHVPVETVATAAEVVDARGVDGCIAIGGGSTIGLAKALSLRHGLPSIAVPTTYAGSELTPIWGLTDAGHKQTGRERVVLPRTVVYDPDLTLSLPGEVSATSGLNAIAHAVEALYAPDGSPVVAAMAERGVRSFATALPSIASDPSDAAARTAALEGAWLCGACLGATTMGLHHKVCHALGGMLDLPHAETHAVVLPYVAAFNLPAAPAARESLARAFASDDPVGALTGLADRLGVPRTLAELGVAEADLGRVADEVLANPYANPRAVTREDLMALLRAAWSGGRLEVSPAAR
jgi:maleylacetate reductase